MRGNPEKIAVLWVKSPTVGGTTYADDEINIL